MTGQDISLLAEPASSALAVERLRYLHPWAPEMLVLFALAALGVQCARRRVDASTLLAAAGGVALLFATHAIADWVREAVTR